jgi:hypothetical protein
MLANLWLPTSFDAWSLGVEASTVIGLRLLKIESGGHAAEAEARQMINEKIESGFALQSMAWSGRLGHNAHDATRKTLAHYRIKVRATDGGSQKGESRCGDMAQHSASGSGTFRSRPRLLHTFAVILLTPR